MGRVLKWVLGAVTLAIAAWSAWWLVGANGQQAGIEAWLAKQRDRGWQAEAAHLDVSGYPADFMLEAREIALADPVTGWAWTAPEWRVHSKVYKPTRFDITWPESQSIAVPGDRADITSEQMAAVLDVRPGTALVLRQISGEVQALAIAGQTGWRAGARAISLNVSERPEDLAPPNSYDMRLEGTKIVLPKALVAQIDPTGWLKPSVDSLTITGHAAFDDPIDRIALEEGRLALRAATIREAGFEWGEMRLVARGAIEVDDAGFPVGEIKIEAREWRQMVRLAVSSGLIDAGTARNVTQGISFLTALTGSGDSLSLPLGLSGGKVRLGPLAIADAPRLAPPR